MKTSFNLEELQAIDRDGVASCECPDCGAFTDLEPDAKGTCPECGTGQIISPLLALGFI